MASRYMTKKFQDDFTELCEMWTSEDGMLMSLTIARRPDAESAIRKHWAFQSKHESFDSTRVQERFVYRGRLEDDGRGVVWIATDTATEFPVYEYELQIPR